MSYDYSKITPFSKERLQYLFNNLGKEEPHIMQTTTTKSVKYIFIKDKQLKGIENPDVMLKVAKGYIPQTTKLFKKGEIVEGTIKINAPEVDAPNVFTFDDFRSNIRFSIPMQDSRGSNEEKFSNYLQPYDDSITTNSITDKPNPPLFSYHYGSKTIAVTGKQLFVVAVLSIGVVYASYKFGLIKK